MNKWLKDIWRIFEKEQVERFYLFFEKDGELHYESLSKNENEKCAEINVNTLIHAKNLLKNQKVWAIHNHPNEKCTPSYADFYMLDYTRSLCALLQITLDDFIIVSPYGYVSFKENNRLTQLYSSFNTYEATSLDFPTLQTHQDVMKHEKALIDRLSHQREILYHSSFAYSSSCFEGSFLLTHRDSMLEKGLFFYKKQETPGEMDRLFAINQTLEPAEMYLLENNGLYPMKLNGLL